MRKSIIALALASTATLGACASTPQNGDIAQGTLAEAGELYAKEYKTWPGVVQKAGIKPT